MVRLTPQAGEPDVTDDIERPRPGRRPSFDKTALHALLQRWEREVRAAAR